MQENKMSATQALKEAQRRYGKTAIVQDNKTPTLVNGQVMAERFCVGRSMGMFFAVEGHGETWEAAFAEIDSRKARETERIEKHRAKLKAEGKL